MRVFQKWMLSGSPSAWRGPGRSSRKKSASCSSKDRRPLGTTLISWGGFVPVVADDQRPPEFLAAFGCDVGAVSALPERPLDAFFLSEGLQAVPNLVDGELGDLDDQGVGYISGCLIPLLTQDCTENLAF